MAKVKQFEKVLELLQNADGAVVTKGDLLGKLGTEIVENRIPTYIWEIKTKAGIPVEAIKEGRKVTGFRVARIDRGTRFRFGIDSAEVGFKTVETSEGEVASAEVDFEGMD